MSPGAATDTPGRRTASGAFGGGRAPQAGAPRRCSRRGSPPLGRPHRTDSAATRDATKTGDPPHARRARRAAARAARRREPWRSAAAG